MSISLFVYSSDPPLGRAFIISACMTGAVSKDVRWELALVRESDELKLNSAGPISNHLVYGWHPDHKEASEARHAFDSGNRAAIDELYARNAAGVVFLSVVTRVGFALKYSRPDGRAADAQGVRTPQLEEESGYG